MQKLKIVADYVPSYKYLNVCLKDGNNCGRFEKCVRTMTGLDALGKLDYYREVFDVDYYNSHKTWYMKKMLKRIARKKHDYFEIYAYKRKDMTVSLYIYKEIYNIFFHSETLLANLLSSISLNISLDDEKTHSLS